MMGGRYPEEKPYSFYDPEQDWEGLRAGPPRHRSAPVSPRGPISPRASPPGIYPPELDHGFYNRSGLPGSPHEQPFGPHEEQDLQERPRQRMGAHFRPSEAEVGSRVGYYNPALQNPEELDNRSRGVGRGVAPSPPIYVNPNFEHLPVSQGVSPNGKYGPKTPLSDGYGRGTPPSDGYGRGAPPSDGYGRGAPPSDGYGRGAPPSDGYGRGALPNDGHARGAPPNESYARGAPPNESYARGAPPNESYAQGAPPNESYAQGIPQKKNSTQGILPNESYARGGAPLSDGYRQGAPSSDGYGRGTPPSDGYGRGTPPSDGYGRGTLPNDSYGRGALPNDNFARGTPRNDNYGRGAPPNDSHKGGVLPNDNFARGTPRNDSYGRGAPPNDNFRRGTSPNDSFGRGTLPDGIYEDKTPPNHRYGQGTSPNVVYEQGDPPNDAYGHGSIEYGRGGSRRGPNTPSNNYGVPASETRPPYGYESSGYARGFGRGQGVVPLGDGRYEYGGLRQPERLNMVEDYNGEASTPAPISSEYAHQVYASVFSDPVYGGARQLNSKAGYHEEPDSLQQEHHREDVLRHPEDF